VADFTITTTADFDAGTKNDPGDGNYGVETITDNPAMTANQLELTGKHGSNYIKADADGNTFKDSQGYDRAELNRAGASGGSADIDTTTSDKLRIYINGAGLSDVTSWGDELEVLLDNTGDWSIEIEWACTIAASNVNRGIVLGIGGAGAGPPSLDPDDFARIIRFYNDGHKRTSCLKNEGGVKILTTNADANNSGKYRIRRTSGTVYIEYNYGGGWVTDGSTDQITHWPNQLVVTVSVLTAANYPSVDTDINYFKVTGYLITGNYRTSGNWLSEEQNMDVGKQLKNLVLTCSGMSVTQKVDKVEIIDGDGSTVLTTYNGDITSNGATTLYSKDFDNGFGVTKHSLLTGGEFHVKVYLAGSGNATPVVSKIEGNYGDGGGVGISAGSKISILSDP
jgi:hypothetical protein